MLETYFQGILLTSLLGAVFALILLALKPVTQKHFSESWHYYIWLVVLVAMLFPIRIELPEIPHNPAISHATANIEAAVENMFESVGLKKSVADKVMYDERGCRLYSPHLQEWRAREVAIRGAMGSIAMGWLGVTFGIFLYKIISYHYYVIKLKKASREVESPEIADFTCRRVQVRKGNFGNSPLLLGVIRPVLLLPDREMTDEQLRNVLSHEMTHLVRNDMLYKWFVVLVKSIHWFNPVVYLVSAQINQSCEISCDLRVTEFMSKEQKMSYVDTILTLFTDQKHRDYALTMGMTGSKELLKKRFLKMKNRIHISEKMRRISGVAAALMLVGVMFISGCLATKVFPDLSGRNMTPVISRCEHCGMDALYVTREPAVQKSQEGVLHPYVYYWFICGNCSHTWKKEQKVASAYIINMKTDESKKVEAVMAGLVPEEETEEIQYDFFAAIIRLLQ